MKKDGPGPGPAMHSALLYTFIESEMCLSFYKVYCIIYAAYCIIRTSVAFFTKPAIVCASVVFTQMRSIVCASVVFSTMPTISPIKNAPAFA